MMLKVLLASCMAYLALANEQEIAGKVRAFPTPTDPTFVEPGLPLPLPRTWQHSENVFGVLGDGFVFNATGHTCDDLEAAFDRYYKMIFNTPNSNEARSRGTGKQTGAPNSQQVTQLFVSVNQPCDGKPRPALGMSENYKLQVTAGKAMLSADTLWGALRGLETFSQIVYETEHDSHGMWLVNETMIEDAPRFQHRGFLIDTSRHFIEKNIILQFVSALSMAKYNVLHWHIVDSESFPYRSRVFPELSRKGAFEPYTHTYDHADIAEVIEYARQRGIRVVVEFDTPGHSLSWGPGQPGLLTPCYGKDGKPDGTYGPIDPSKNSTYEFLEKLFTEVNGVFPDQYIHLGGDEVSFTCWQSNPDINKFMTTIGLNPGDYSGLESYYITRLTQMVSKIGNSYIVWQEPLDNGVKLSKQTVVNVWKSNPPPFQELAKVTKAGYLTIMSECWYLNRIEYGENWHSYYTCDPQLAPDTVVNVWKWFGTRNGTQEMEFVTQKGFKAITSACWYLNILSYGEDWHQYYQCDPQLSADTVVNVWKNYGVRKADEEMEFVTGKGYKAITSACWYLNILSYGEDWHKYYQCDPLNFNGTDAQKALVMGGEGCMWGEWVDGTNLMSRTWPRAAVVGERLWSPATATDLTSMKARLEAHRCRMIKRGLDANPIDPSYCRYEKQADPPKF